MLIDRLALNIPPEIHIICCQDRSFRQRLYDCFQDKTVPIAHKSHIPLPGHNITPKAIGWNIPPEITLPVARIKYSSRVYIVNAGIE
jgi:hypothetical protein